ncbi:VOC family protein [Paenibacillus mendelii]|uniref:VOC family protein n=1 Tax=Paenibacillus mendelii TaxID=206163 RepID=A0ABV6J2H1_9BACL|nr:VOC family protein [Paenibacillus mendelii]MCQ6563285.1 VOC family protein [Paenibacillus mendelii]
MSGKLQGNGLKCICSVYVPVRDPAKSARWWQRNFGLEFAVPFSEESDQAIMKLSEGQWLHLVQTEGQIDNQFPNKAGYEMFRLTFEVREIEVLHDHLLGNGVQIEELEDRGSCGINFVFYDPDGNKFDVNENVSMYRAPEEVEKVKNHLFAYAR